MALCDIFIKNISVKKTNNYKKIQIQIFNYKNKKFTVQILEQK